MRLPRFSGEGDVVEEFRRSRGCVLFGVETLWTGLDIPGDALSAVVVPKLPFPNPESAEAYQDRERDWSSYQARYLSTTAFKLRQGLGRLVRNPTDRGLFLVLDPRADNPDRLPYLNEHLGIELAVISPTDLEGWIRAEAHRHGLIPTGP
jgi:Rad3-related DNA helicase